LFRLDERGVYRAQILEDLPWLEHGFGTRTSIDWPGERAIASLRQIHSDRVLIAEGPVCAGEGDALITDRPGIPLTIRTADCLPILAADTRNRAVAAIHAGWRGVVQEIVPKTLVAMAERFGSRPEDLRIAIGPGIGACCFEVGPEVARKFASLFPERDDLFTRTRVDLLEAVCRQLSRSDVTAGQTAALGLCTACHKDTFHSYRREREAAGRMVSLIGIREEAFGSPQKRRKARD